MGQPEAEKGHRISRRRVTIVLLAAAGFFALPDLLGIADDRSGDRSEDQEEIAKRHKSTYLQDLANTSLIPSEYGSRSVNDLVREAVLPRLGVDPTLHTLPYVVCEIDTPEEVLRLTYKEGNRSDGRPYDISGILVTRKDTQNRYMFQFGESSSRTNVISGETANRQEALEIKNRIGATLINVFNESVMVGRRLEVSLYETILN